MARMLNLQQVLELINDSFHNRPAAQQQFVLQQQQLIGHVALDMRDEAHLARAQ